MANKLKFEYLGAPQRSPEWFKIRIGKVSASRLEDWLSVSKSKANPGAPLKKRLDYEKELLFERTFDTNFEKWSSSAMEQGQEMEDFGRRQYEKIKGVTADECGCWYNDYFVASPDSTVGEDGLLEIKVLYDTSFSEVLVSGVPDKHWKQIQGQLWATGRKWCDYVAVNLHTGKIKIIRVLPDQEFHDWLELAVPEPLSVEPIDTKDIYDFIDKPPEALMISGPAPEENGGMEW